MMKKIFALLLTALLLCCLAACAEEPVPTESAPELLDPVSANLDSDVVKRGDVRVQAYYKAEVVPYVQSLYFGASGTIGSVLVKEGDWVEAGQLLAKLDNGDILSDIEAKEAEIAHEEKLGKFSSDLLDADISIAKEQLKIMKENGASKEAQTVKELEIQKLQLQLQQEKELRDLDLAELYQQLQELKDQLFDPELRAPFAGRVVYIAGETGTSISKSKPVIVLADNDRTYISTSNLKLSQYASSVEVYARVLNQDVKITYVPWEGDPYLEDMTDSGSKLLFSWEAEVPLVAGDYAVIMSTTQLREDVLYIPKNALHRDADGYFVYLMVDGKQVRTVVTPGLMTQAVAEIVEGVKEGDVVYVQG